MSAETQFNSADEAIQAYTRRIYIERPCILKTGTPFALRLLRDLGRNTVQWRRKKTTKNIGQDGQGHDRCHPGYHTTKNGGWGVSREEK